MCGRLQWWLVNERPRQAGVGSVCCVLRCKHAEPQAEPEAEPVMCSQNASSSQQQSLLLTGHRIEASDGGIHKSRRQCLPLNLQDPCACLQGEP